MKTFPPLLGIATILCLSYFYSVSDLCDSMNFDVREAQISGSVTAAFNLRSSVFVTSSATGLNNPYGFELTYDPSTQEYSFIAKQTVSSVERPYIMSNGRLHDNRGYYFSILIIEVGDEMVNTSISINGITREYNPGIYHETLGNAPIRINGVYSINSNFAGPIFNVTLTSPTAIPIHRASCLIEADLMGRFVVEDRIELSRPTNRA